MICSAHMLTSSNVSNSKVCVRSVLFIVAEKNLAFCGISGFRREVAHNCALLGCYPASSGNFTDVSG